MIHWKALLPATLGAGLFLCLYTGALSAQEPARLSFAHQQWLKMAVGFYIPGQGWVPSDRYYQPPQPGDTMSLFDVGGKAAEVRVVEPWRPEPSGIPIAWRAAIERWKSAGEPYALAIQGSWPAPAQVPAALSLQDTEAVQSAAAFLKKKGESVPAPFLTQAFRQDLGDSRYALFLAAHSDVSALKAESAASVYAAIWMEIHAPGQPPRVYPLMAQVSHKPAGRTLADQEMRYGVRDYYRFLTFVDLDGDSRNEIVLYEAEQDATVIHVYTFDGSRLKEVLNTYKQNSI